MSGQVQVLSGRPLFLLFPLLLGRGRTAARTARTEHCCPALSQYSPQLGQDDGMVVTIINYKLYVLAANLSHHTPVEQCPGG